MKVLHICNGAQSNSPFYKFLFKALKTNQVEQSVIVPVWKTPTIDFEDIRCEYFYRNSGFLSRLMFHRKIRKLTQFTIEKFDVGAYQIIHAHTWFSDGAVAYNLHKKYKIPYIIAIRNTDINIFYKYFFHLRKLGNKILESAAQIVFISPAYKDYFVNQIVSQQLKRKIEDRISVIPNGISAFWLSNVVQKPDMKTSAKLLTIGAITPNKNQLALCNAVELLRKEGLELELTLVGKGYKDATNYLKKIENYIEGKPYIRILEKQNEEELLVTFRNHDIFVLPSHTETFGLVYIEALTQGLPVIYSKGQGIDGYFEHGKIGYGVNSKKIKEIAESIAKIVLHYSTFTENVGKIDFSMFDWERITEQYLRIYQIGSYH